jgi:hypothetical protein
MKKYLFIAVTSFLFMVSCSKADLSPDQDIKKVTKINPGVPVHPTLPQSHCFTITNTETNWGVVEYKVSYTDCNGVNHTVPLLMGQSITVCLADGTVTANFSYTLVDIGVC